MSMVSTGNEYWDEHEFKFFDTLDDIDKLLYIYDLMIGEFVYEYEGTGNPIEFDNSTNATESNRIDVQMEFTQNEKGQSQVTLSGSNVNMDILQSVAQALVMNGMVLMNETIVANQDWDSSKPWGELIQLRYDLIGNVNPISVN